MSTMPDLPLSSGELTEQAAEVTALRQAMSWCPQCAHQCSVPSHDCLLIVLQVLHAYGMLLYKRFYIDFFQISEMFSGHCKTTPPKPKHQ